MTQETTTHARWDLPKQTIFGFGDGPDRIFGDCFRCCIAAVLQLPASEVPHFVQIANGLSSYDGYAQTWLGKRGFWMLTFELNSIFGDGPPFHMVSEAGYHPRTIPIICSGPTVRSKKPTDQHAVVMEGGRTVYDPHPSEAGLLAVTHRYLIVPQLP